MSHQSDDEWMKPTLRIHSIDITMPSPSALAQSAEPEPPLPRPTVVGGSRPSSRASSRARSITSGHSSRSSSPAQRQQSIPLHQSAGPSRPSALRASRSASQEATASSSTSRNSVILTEYDHIRPSMNASDMIVISSDSSGDEEDGDDFVMQWQTDPVTHPPPTSEFFEVAGVRRAPPAVHRADLFSPPPHAGTPAEPILFQSGSAGRNIGVSADPRTGDFLMRPMPIVRPTATTTHFEPDPDGSFTIVSAQTVAPRQRSDHPITDQRLRCSNLAMPTKSPPRSKPPPIEHPLLSTYTCPICFDAPKNLSVTPCGHFFCGECLFQALKTQAVQRGTMEEEYLGNIFSPFAPAGTFGPTRSEGGPNNSAGPNSSGGGRGGHGGGTGGHRARKKPDPLAGQCPVCRAKIKGAFNGREKNGIVGLRLMMGRPINDPRERNGQMKSDRVDKKDDESSLSESEDDEVVLPTSKHVESPSEKDAQPKIGGKRPRKATG